jgi:hypothetical protein
MMKNPENSLELRLSVQKISWNSQTLNGTIETSYTEFHWNRSIDTEIMGVNAFGSLSNV